MSDTSTGPQDGEAAVPEDGAFDGDATTQSMAGGVAPGGTDALPEGDGQPPQDGGVMGAVGGDGVPPSVPDVTTTNRGAAVPPEEQGR
jgi:hypothetical protein